MHVVLPEQAVVEKVSKSVSVAEGVVFRPLYGGCRVHHESGEFVAYSFAAFKNALDGNWWFCGAANLSE
jgi:hypothetical protein